MKEPGPPAKDKGHETSRGHDEVDLHLDHALEEIEEAQSMWSSLRARKERIMVRLYTVIRVEEADRRPTKEEITETKEAETDSKESERSRINLKRCDEPTAQTLIPRHTGDYGRSNTLRRQSKDLGL